MRRTNKYLAFAILVGGKSSRLGIDKGLFDFRGKPFISHQIEVLSQISNEIFIVANSKEQVQLYLKSINYTNIIAFIIDDNEIIHESDFRNPMLGLYSTFKELKKLHYEKVFVLSCDNPLIQPQVIRLILQNCQNYDCCIPKWKNGFLEPLFTVYPISLAFKSTEKNLLEKKYKLTNIIEKSWKINYVSVEKSIKTIDTKLFSFRNLNDIEQIKELERVLNKI